MADYSAPFSNTRKQTKGMDSIWAPFSRPVWVLKYRQDNAVCDLCCCRAERRRESSRRQKSSTNDFIVHTLTTWHISSVDTVLVPQFQVNWTANTVSASLQRMPNFAKDLGVFYGSMNRAIEVLVLTGDRRSVFVGRLDGALGKVGRESALK